MKAIVLSLVVVLGWFGPAAAQMSSASMDWGRFYTRAEYLLWWMKDSPTPVPLVIDGPTSDPNTRTLLGGGDFDSGHRHGMRLTLGGWFDEDRVWGMEVGGFWFPTGTDKRTAFGPATPGSRDLLVPFFSANSQSESVSFLSAVDAFSGEATEKMTTRFWGAEASMLIGVVTDGPWRMEFLTGFRYLKLGEKYSFETNSPDLPPGPATVFGTEDVFDAENNFYGGQIGIRGRYQSDRWMADASLKVAVGAMRQSMRIDGVFTTNFFSPPLVTTFPGGMFAQPTNMGKHSRDIVAVIPELGINVGFRLTPWASIVAGYTFMYANNVVRPGRQIDRSINTTQAPAISLNPNQTLVGDARPSFKFEGTDFWAHGLNVGFALQF